MSLYQYGGTLTLDVEDSHERQLELLRMAEQRSWDAAEEARVEARRIARQNVALRDQLADQRRKKRNAQTQARRLREKLSEALQNIPEPDPEPPQTVHGGREGLEAAAQEVAEFARRKRQERKAA